MAANVGTHAVAASGASNSTTTGAVTTTASGSSFVIAVCYPNSDTITSVTDSKSNVYSLIRQVADAGDGFKAAWYLCENGVGGASHTGTVQISATNPKTVYFCEITGGALSSLTDQESGVLDTSSPFDSSITTTNANDLILTFVVSNNATATITLSGGFATVDSENAGAVDFATNLGSRVVSSTGSYSPAATASAGGNAVVLTAGFKALAAATTTLAPPPHAQRNRRHTGRH